jgi:ankyrin repeat protein
MGERNSPLMAIHQACRRGDLAALRAALGDPADFPNSRPPLGAGDHCLEYAIYHGPLPFIRALLELGANPNYQESNGFPSLIAALSTDRADRSEILALLIAFGADVGQRGLNDQTPLHYAVARNDLPAIGLLLAQGADPEARTRIDDRTTPLEDALILARTEAARLIEHAIAQRQPRAGRDPGAGES